MYKKEAETNLFCSFPLPMYSASYLTLFPTGNS